MQKHPPFPSFLVVIPGQVPSAGHTNATRSKTKPALTNESAFPWSGLWSVRGSTRRQQDCVVSCISRSRPSGGFLPQR
ncbi:hypothetical protein SODALDRAFT_65762 [Sodiomyces alkalinus F11]|uniref:Uncharacterized protein n=1 Tax=Sodiomyces alkalinus (strain CBS 110278 / VKM F-3762 / F11) TaxID=1314773 RepID=A0A3N2PLM6_SODAK|nr:hypothetical protein SODALDRAFT_65762 [Sodiomyces alkalinus F11]ROT35427.1 hypothetical protein SODALDRAFT_65762 [Sodiomyces alkalinus F11]